MPFPLDRALARLVGREWVLRSRVARETYSYDAGTSEGLPDLVVLPGDRDQLTSVIRLAQARKTPIVVRGAGTCLSGGPVATQGGIVVVLTRLNRILDLDPASRTALVEPGVVNADLRRAAERWGLTFPVDPSSLAVATLGGNAAENAGGPGAVKHGVFRQHVLGLEFLLPDGTLAQTGHLGPGWCCDLPRPLLELSSLLVGSEGTLAILTRLALRLTPTEAERVTLLAFFDRVEPAARAVSRIISLGLGPSALEIMGRLDIELAEKACRLGLPAEAEAMLLVEFAGPGPGLGRQLARAEAAVRESAPIRLRRASDEAERDRLWLARRASTGAYGQLRPAYIPQDVTVPRDRIPEMFAKVAEITATSRLPVSLVGHAGDGNLHPAVLLDDRLPDEVEEARAINRTLIMEAVRLGGTVSGEHGIGVEKLEFMDQIFSPATLAYFRAVKRAFDPGGILNPGKLVPKAPLDTVNSPLPPLRVKPARPGRPHPPAPTPLPGRSALPTDAILARLEELLGGEVIAAQEVISGWGFDRLHRPAALVLPSTVEALAGAVRLLAENRVPVWPVGGGGLAQVAFAPFEGGVALSTARLGRVTEILFDNLTFAAEAGYALDRLSHRLLDEGGPAGRGLTYPIDCWRGPGSTLGGEVATNACGPFRPRYGTTRDQLLGVTFVNAQGSICRAGGRTVKNVAGYDVTRLLCGSWGALGVIAEATLRLAPRPEAERCLEAPIVDPTPAADLIRALSGDLDPVALVLVPPATAGDSWRLKIQLAGSAEDVEAWDVRLRQHLAAAGLEPRSLGPGETASGWEDIRAHGPSALARAWRSRPEPWVVGYARVAPAAAPATAAALYREARNAGWTTHLTAQCSMGLIDIGALAPARPGTGGPAGGSDAGALRLLAAFERVLRPEQFGLYAWQGDLEAALAGKGPVSAYPTGSARLVRALKDELDPAAILAPTARLVPSPGAPHPTGVVSRRPRHRT